MSFDLDQLIAELPELSPPVELRHHVLGLVTDEMESDSRKASGSWNRSWIYPGLAIAAAAVLMVFGLGQLRSMPVDILPEFSRPYVEVQTEALGLSANEVEAMLTVPLEADLLNGVPWLDEIRSESIPGLSSIVLFFEPDVDMMRALRVYKEVAYPYMIMPDHAPAISGPEPHRAAFAYCYGYIHALLQVVDEAGP